MIEPVIEAFTRPYISGPFDSAIMAMISSAALPKVAFSSPPTPAPSVSARFSVARPISPARGMMASAETTKTASPAPRPSFSPTASGRAASSQ